MTEAELPAFSESVQRALAHGEYLLGQSKDTKLEVLNTLRKQQEGGAGISFGDQFRVAEQSIRNFAAGVVTVFEAMERLDQAAEGNRWTEWAAISAANAQSRVIRFELTKSTQSSGIQLNKDQWKFPGSLSFTLSSYPGGTAAREVTPFVAVKHSGSRYYTWNYGGAAVDRNGELDITWLLQSVAARFTIDRSCEQCRTPRRNPQVERALAFAVALSAFSTNLTQGVFECEDYYDDYDYSSVFVPSTPMFLRRNDGAHTIDFFDADTVSAEHRRSLNENLEIVDKRLTDRTPKLSNGDVPVADWLASNRIGRVCYLGQHLRALCSSVRASVGALEDSLLIDIQQRLGTTHLRGAVFHDYLRFHCARMPAGVAARPFALPVRTVGHASEGTVTLQDAAKAPLPTFVQGYGRHHIQFRLDAATLVSINADCSLHGFVSTSFANSLSFGSLTMSLRARQFSCYLVLMGRLQGARRFDPQYAVLVQNKDLLEVPLDVFLVPSAQEFADAIASMSPQQQAFAKAYREMQLASTLFAMLVVPVKPLLENLLGLPADSLDKDIALTQDLIRLFSELQIPADLLSCQPHKAAAVGPVDQVKANVARLLDSIGNIGPPRDRTCIFSVEETIAQLDIERYHLSLPSVTELTELGCGDENDEPIAVLDVGTHKTLAGFAGRTWSSEIKTVIGRPRHMGVMVGMGQKDSYSGAECESSGPAIEKPPGADDDAGASSNAEDSTQDSTKSSDAASTTTNVELRDFTQVPNVLDARFQALGGEGAVRPLILTPGKQWFRKVQTSLLDEVGTSTLLNEQQQLAEKKLAFDLLDCLSKSAGLVLEAGELHVIVGAAHCFDQSLMSLLVEKNTNPISVLERSIQVVEQVVHQ